MTAALATPLFDIRPDAAAAEHVRHRPPLVLAVRAAPRREPPFDDELTAPSQLRNYDQSLPLPRAGRRYLEVVAADSELPDPTRWSRSLLIGITEAAGGKRPLQQIAAMFSLGVSHGLSRDFDRAWTLGRRHWSAGSIVRSVRCSQPTEGVAEVSATLQCGQRVRAVALRLENLHGQWKCVRLQLG